MESLLKRATVALAIMTALNSQAMAVAKLVSSIPVANEVVTQRTQQIGLQFSEDLLNPIQITVTGPKGRLATIFKTGSVRKKSRCMCLSSTCLDRADTLSNGRSCPQANTRPRELQVRCKLVAIMPAIDLGSRALITRHRCRLLGKATDDRDGLGRQRQRRGNQDPFGLNSPIQAPRWSGLCSGTAATDGGVVIKSVLFTCSDPAA